MKNLAKTSQYALVSIRNKDYQLFLYHRANAPHIWCEGLTPFVLTAKHIAKYYNDKSKTTVKENVHSRTSNSAMDDYYNHKT